MKKIFFSNNKKKMKFFSNWNICHHFFIHSVTRYLDRFLYRYHNTTHHTRVSKNDGRPDFIVSIIIPVYNGRVKWLKEAIDSVICQTANNWELYIVDDCSTNTETIHYLKAISDPRIHIIFLSTNGGISNTLNTGITCSKGSYVTFLDQDDILTPEMLEILNKAIQKYDADILYTDECLYYQKIFNLFSLVPHFKPDYSPDLLLSHNYVTHLMVLKRDIIERAGLFQSEYDGAQDYDLILRASELGKKICHIRKVLYHWRIHANSTSNALDSGNLCEKRGKSALEMAMVRRNIEGNVELGSLQNFFKLQRSLLKTPLVSIIIPFKDQPHLLNQCLTSICNKTTYPSYEVLLVDNNSELVETVEIIRKWQKIFPNFRIIKYPHPFNYSAINNLAVSVSSGEYIIMMNNDVEILTPFWIEKLLEHGQRDEVGAVGGKLYYPNGLIQHAGIAIGVGGVAGCPYKNFPGDSKGHFNHLILTRNVSAVTGALLLVNKEKYLSIGGLDEENLKISLNDVDFCLRLLEKGYLNVFTPFCEAIHAESISRGYDNIPEKINRAKKEADYLLKRYKSLFDSGDPWYNPNFSLNNEGVRFERDIPAEKLFGVFYRGENGKMYYEPIIMANSSSISEYPQKN